MWPFQSRPRLTMLVAARPHPSHLLRIKPKRSAPKDHPASVPKMVIFVRSDLKMSSAKVAAHAVHAALNLYQLACSKVNSCSRWKNTGQKKTVIKVGGEAHLESLIISARRYNLPAVVVRDARTASNGKKPKTAIGVLGPMDILEKMITELKNK